MKERDNQLRKINQTKAALEELILDIKNINQESNETNSNNVNKDKDDSQAKKQVTVINSIGKNVDNLNSHLNNLNTSIRNITDNEKNYQTNNMEILDYICQQQIDCRSLI